MVSVIHYINDHRVTVASICEAVRAGNPNPVQQTADSVSLTVVFSIISCSACRYSRTADAIAANIVR